MWKHTEREQGLIQIHLIQLLKLGISTATVLSQVKLEGKYLRLCYDLQNCYRTPAPAVCAMNTKQIILSCKIIKTQQFIAITLQLFSSIISLSYLCCRPTEVFPTQRSCCVLNRYTSHYPPLFRYY